MSGATRSTPSLYLPDVEAKHQPGIYRDLIASARGRDKALAARGYIRD
jgi:hypothetical protein